MKLRISSVALLGAFLVGIAPAHSQVKKDVAVPIMARITVPIMPPVAVLAFQERGTGVRDYGSKIGDILYATLGTDDKILLVDRQDITATLTEQNLNLSGAVRPDEATRVGQLTGAKVLVTGSVFEAGKTLYLTAKIIGTETTRVLTESVKGATTDDLATLGEMLSSQVAARIAKDSSLLVSAPESTKDIIADLNRALGAAPRRAVTINIPERHVGQPTVDPAAATEIALIAKAVGFEVFENAAGIKPAPLQIVGEGFSELATRIGGLVSVKARLEVKVIDPTTGNVMAIDRQTVFVVDVSEQIAGKSALQKAAVAIAERILPQLIVKADKK